jgi:hypothetical protein
MMIWGSPLQVCSPSASLQVSGATVTSVPDIQVLLFRLLAMSQVKSGSQQRSLPVANPGVRDLVASAFLCSAQIEQQLAVKDAAFVVVGELRRTRGFAVGAANYGVLDGGAGGEVRLQVEIDGP